MVQINASIVLYHNKIDQLIKVINSFLDTTLNVRLYLIDNSSSDELKFVQNLDDRIEYIFNNANLGYGSAHNIAMKKSIDDSVPYHLVLNPDVYFENNVLESIFNYMQNNQDVGLLMPKVLYPNGTLQPLCKLLPTPLDLFARRFIPVKSFVEKINKRYQLDFFDYEQKAEIPFLSGCFMFLRTDILKKNCLFDENFFMYLEDADLTRRIGRIAKTIYYPNVSIYHEYQRGAHNNKKLLWIFIRSTFTYFKKYGWFFDLERKKINEMTLKRLGYYKK